MSAADNSQLATIVNRYTCKNHAIVLQVVLTIAEANNGYGGRVAQLLINSQKHDGWYYKGRFSSNLRETNNSPSFASWQDQDGIHRKLVVNDRTYKCFLD